MRKLLCMVMAAFVIYGLPVEMKRKDRRHRRRLPNKILIYLPGSIDWIAVLSFINCKRHFYIERLMLAGGGIMNWSFVPEDLVDELSIVMVPVADGSMKTASAFEKRIFFQTEHRRFSN